MRVFKQMFPRKTSKLAKRQALHFARRKRIRLEDVTSLISATISIEHAINSRRNLLVFSFLLRTRKLMRWNSVNGIEAGARCIAVLPPFPPSRPRRRRRLMCVLLVRCTYVRDAHARGSTAKYYWTTGTRTHLPRILFRVGLCRAAPKEHARKKVLPRHAK